MEEATIVTTYTVEDIVAYVMKTPENVNPAILIEMLNNLNNGETSSALPDGWNEK